MCGIAGHIGIDSLTPRAIKTALARMFHRGPDAQGHCSVPFGRLTATMLHSRLSIVDLDARSNQPFHADNCVLIYNGEIYNHIELRAELESLGHRFNTTSDTEVIVKAWRSWGEDCVKRLEGMWAIALFDQRDSVFFLSRDRFGEKPLFFAANDGEFSFASDVATLSAVSGKNHRVNIEQIRRYLVNGYKSLYKQPATFFEDVHVLPPATSVTLRPDTCFTDLEAHLKSYWSLNYNPTTMSADEALDGVRERLNRAVGICLRADVPLAFCLSGGVDSSTIAAIAAKNFGADVSAFSVIDQDDRYDESANIEANVKALGCRHFKIHTSQDGFLDRLMKQSTGRSAPVATISYYVHNFISEAIRGNGFKIAISGTAADELFTGYYDHYNFWLAQMRGCDELPSLIEDWRRGCGAVVRNPVLKDPLSFADNPGRRDHIYLDRDRFNETLETPLSEDFFEENYSDDGLRNRMLNELFHETVPILLQEDDSNSMEYSVENRSPFLDKELAEFLFSVPNEHLIANGRMKWLLREAGKGMVPDTVRLDKAKKGFNASIELLLDRNDSNVTDRLMASGPIFDIVKRNAIEKMLATDLTDNSFSKFMFSFISARFFLDAQTEDGATDLRRAA